MVLIYRNSPCSCPAWTAEWWHLSGVVVDILGPALVPVGQQLDGWRGRAEPQQVWSFLIQETVIVEQVLVQHGSEEDTGRGGGVRFVCLLSFYRSGAALTQRIQQRIFFFFLIPVKMKKVMIKMKTSPPGNKGTTAASSFAPFRHEDRRGQRDFESNLLVLSCRYKRHVAFQ